MNDKRKCAIIEKTVEILAVQWILEFPYIRKLEKKKGITMQYHSVISGYFRARPNRFVAYVETSDGIQTVHVKNTGRCRELLVPGALVYLEKSRNPDRKTAYDLIAVEKKGLLVNMDSQAPNQVFEEWVKGGSFVQGVRTVRREYFFGASRIDFCLETERGVHLVEVKGVTLEENGKTRFPDAPTQRGIKHIQELQRAVKEGLDATLFFVVQMEGAKSMQPNDETHPAFGAALREATAHGVRVCAYDCEVNPDSLSIRREIPVIL